MEAIAMEKVFSFDLSKDHYTAEVCFVECFDIRFQPLMKGFSKMMGFKNPDIVRCAGGAKSLAGPDGGDKDFVLTQIRKSMKLHGTKKVILMVHIDCGDYGGSSPFVGRDAELVHHTDELGKAAQVVKDEFPDLLIECYVADFDGLYRVS